LVNENILDIIASTLDIDGKNILEIGPWYGALTEKLLELKPKSLHLVELDKEMISILNQRIENWELSTTWIDFQIFNEDVLKFNVMFEQPCHCESNEAIQKIWNNLVNGLLRHTSSQWQHITNNKNYYLIANIPYYITSPILQKFLYNIENKPEKMLILMQKDVGDKILDGQNLKKNKIKSSVLSLFIAKKSSVKEIIQVPASSFIPTPKVESSVLLFETHDNYKEIDDKEFLKFIKIWFQEPRKKLINNLAKWWIEKETILGIFESLWFAENIRWEDLNIDEWIELFKKIYCI